MKVVIDCNRVIAALLKDGTTRDIIFDSFFEFISPDFLISELRKHQTELRKKANITNEEFEILLSILFENISIIPKEEYESNIRKLKNELEDINDLPYLAVAKISSAQGIWTHDKGFEKQNIIRVYSNIDLLELSMRK